MTVLVVGGGIAGLVAARTLSIQGHRVTLIEADERLGGSVRSAPLAGLAIDVGAESVATKGTGALELIGALGLMTAQPRRGGAWLQLDDRAVPLPAAGVLGIPSVPLADDVRAAIGWGGAGRAYLDTIRPELRVGKRETLGSLVARRMGRKVLDILVRPVVEGVYGVDPDDADADALAPGLTTALARAGSLAGAVATIRGNAPAGAAVAGIVGGVHLLVAALEEDLTVRGVEIVTGTRVRAIAPDGTGWRLEHDGGVIDGEQVVLATGGAPARALLSELIDPAAVAGWPEGRTTTVVALALDDERLDAASRGTGVLVARPEEGTASALTHSSAKWPWLRESLPAGRHIVRLTYRGEWPGLPDERIRDDAYRLLGIAASPAAAIDRAEAIWHQDAPRAARGVAGRLAGVASAAAGVDGLSITGSWVAGTGLADVIRHASAISPS